VELASSGIMFMKTFVKIDKVVPKLKWGKYKGHLLFFSKKLGL